MLDLVVSGIEGFVIVLEFDTPTNMLCFDVHQHSSLCGCYVITLVTGMPQPFVLYLLVKIHTFYG